MSANIPYSFGCIQGKKDVRDIAFMAVPGTPLPKAFSLRGKMPTVYDQGQLGSCTANAIGTAFQYKYKNTIMPSRLFIYYNERAMENTVDCDCGAIIRDGMKSINKQGACLENIWKYDILKFNIKPSDPCYSQALKYKIQKYSSVSQVEYSIKSALFNNMPVVFGFLVKESFVGRDVSKTGVYTPKTSEQVVGGHAVLIVGWDDASKRFIVRNSWGTGWGERGYFTMPYSEVLNDDISFDFWVIN